MSPKTVTYVPKQNMHKGGPEGGFNSLGPAWGRMERRRSRRAGVGSFEFFHTFEGLTGWVVPNPKDSLRRLRLLPHPGGDLYGTKPSGLSPAATSLEGVDFATEG